MVWIKMDLRVDAVLSVPAMIVKSPSASHSSCVNPWRMKDSCIGVRTRICRKIIAWMATYHHIPFAIVQGRELLAHMFTSNPVMLSVHLQVNTQVACTYLINAPKP